MSLDGKILSFLRALVSSRERKAATTGIIIGILYLLHWSQQRTSAKISLQRSRKANKGSVDLDFFKRTVELLKIVVPSWKSLEMLNLVLLSGLLVARTLLSISISSVNGRIVKSIVTRDLNLFMKRIIQLAMFAIPASMVNSGLDYLSHKLAIQFRARMAYYFNQKYLSGLIYYQMSNLDNRIANPDQRFTQDIDKWASCLSNLYSNITKPCLDIFLFSRKLSDLVGAQGPIIIIGWYFLSGIIIKFITPPFGLLTAQEQQNEGLYRACQSDIVNHAEEIAFYRGNDWEKRRINGTLGTIVKHINNILAKRFFMGTFDSMLVKYGATMTAYGVLGLPVFGPNKEKYFARIGNDPSSITRDYIRNSSLLINLAKAIGRLVVSYKDLQALAGYTTLIHEAKVVLEDLSRGKYQRTMIEGSSYDQKSRGNFIIADYIKFENVPVVSPNGDLLIDKLSFTIKPGMHTFIQGPNGCGKSSLFRILGELWPLFAGTVYKPPMEQLFYIPQRPYLPHGSLREQIIYPHSKEQMEKSGISDAHLENLMRIVRLEDIIEKRGGFDQIEDWNDTLSGGQKQKIAMCRLLYHKPKFAILDECTSAVSIDVEGSIYQHYKDNGITLITVSHRESLLKYHNHVLKFDGEGGWNFYTILADS
ncbi:ABCD3_2 [Blepharisma stoltei]|uniref:ATP-binding cassette sub-family D member 3 n=1 Tax=Blepharisma stoltei TaxID=1481888 RepID=A0AAU9K3M7_9CILI|nr:unnamed protein product [Blepharisma stoltei]